MQQRPSPAIQRLGRGASSVILDPVRRVSVIGNSGSGKSRLAQRLAETLGVPYIELDAIHHLADWEAIDPETFLARVAEITATDYFQCLRSQAQQLRNIVERTDPPLERKVS